MNGRKLSNKIMYVGMEKAVRRLAVKEKLASPEEVAEMTSEEVCELVAQEYEVLYAEEEEVGLVKYDDLDEVKSLIKKICR